jgi:hypothetical protein
MRPAPARATLSGPLSVLFITRPDSVCVSGRCSATLMPASKLAIRTARGEPSTLLYISGMPLAVGDSGDSPSAHGYRQRKRHAQLRSTKRSDQKNASNSSATARERFRRGTVVVCAPAG